MRRAIVALLLLVGLACSDEQVASQIQVPISTARSVAAEVEFKTCMTAAQIAVNDVDLQVAEDGTLLSYDFATPGVDPASVEEVVERCLDPIRTRS